MHQWRLGHRPGLDGLRGIAVLLVVGYHVHRDYVSAAGVVGVTAFFVLSGFLITALLLEEHDRTGKVSFGGFYARRARRLFPALGAFLAVMVTLQIATNAVDFVDLAAVPAVVLYAGNWVSATGSHAMFALSHTWSLAVEEQFYLLWPIALVVICRGRESRVLWFAGIGALASLMLRLGLWQTDALDRLYYGTDTSAFALLVGCCAAVMVRRGLRVPRWSVEVGILALVALAVVSRDRFVVGPIAATMIAVVIVVGLASHSRAGWLGSRPLVALGHRSYSLYLWHFPLVWYVAPRLSGTWAVNVTLMLALSLALTELSWRFVEQPFLRKRPASELLPEVGALDVNGRVAVGSDRL